MATCRDVDSASDHITQLCDFCETEIADGYCNDCEIHMCQSCFDKHTKSRPSRHHVLTDLTCRQNNQTTRFESCELHPSLNIKYYCVTHNFVGCSECFFPDHRNCRFQDIADAVHTFKENGEDEQMKEELAVLQDDYSHYVRFCYEDAEIASSIHDTFVTNVRELKERVIAHVNQLETNILSKADTLRTENEDRINKRKDELDDIGEGIEQCLVKLEKQENACKLFMTVLDIKRELKKLKEKMGLLDCQNAVIKYAFKPSITALEIAEGSCSIGEIRKMQDNERSDEEIRRDDGQTRNTGDNATLLSTLMTRTRGFFALEEKQMEKNTQRKNKSRTADKSENKRTDQTPLCSICMDVISDPKTIKCGHTFCCDCIDEQFRYKKKCPLCGINCGIITGDQPDGIMLVDLDRQRHLPGYEADGTIIITYTFKSGKQQHMNPSPGRWYKGCTRQAFLPDNNEGKNILRMLRVAFERKLIFTIGRDLTSGMQDVIIWNISHKTKEQSLPGGHGYPDPTYLDDVRKELATMGITEEKL